MAPDERPSPDPEALAAALGSSVLHAARIPWGDSGTTHRLDLGDGRRFAARAVETRSRDAAVRAVEAMTDAGRAGIPVPAPMLVDVGGTTWFVTPWIDGDVGARWLDTPERARSLATAMGSLHRAVRAIDPSLAPQAFVHGDFAPVNVILAAHGSVAALLDFEHAHVGDPLADVAWWGWVVRHHHPEAWAAAWPTFCRAAGADPQRDASIVHALTLEELSRRAEAAADELTRRGWLDRLAVASTW